MYTIVHTCSVTADEWLTPGKCVPNGPAGGSGCDQKCIKGEMKLEKANLKRSPHFVPDHKKSLWVFLGTMWSCCSLIAETGWQISPFLFFCFVRQNAAIVLKPISLHCKALLVMQAAVNSLSAGSA